MAGVVAGDQTEPVLAGVYQVETPALVPNIEAVVLEAERQRETLARDVDPLELLARDPVVHDQGLVLGQGEDLPVSHLHCQHGLGVAPVESQLLDLLPVVHQDHFLQERH